MEQKEKLIGIFVARAFEENNLNFIHALHRIGKKQGYKLVIFSLDTCVERNLEMRDNQEPRYDRLYSGDRCKA